MLECMLVIGIQANYIHRDNHRYTKCINNIQQLVQHRNRE